MTEVIVKIFKDGNSFCALIGNDVMDGVVGFGDTISEALDELSGELEEQGYTLEELEELAAA